MTTGPGFCARCAVPLRHPRPRAGALCDRCRRAEPDPLRDIPPDFFFQDPIVAALADYDFGAVFRRVRAHTGWSQQILGNLVGLDRSRVSAIERGVNRLLDVALVAQVTNGLRIPPILLGFEVGVAGVDIDRLIASLSGPDSTGTRHVGVSDVAVIEQAAAVFTRQDFATGAGALRDIALAQLPAALGALLSGR